MPIKPDYLQPKTLEQRGNRNHSGCRQKQTTAKKSELCIAAKKIGQLPCQPLQKNMSLTYAVKPQPSKQAKPTKQIKTKQRSQNKTKQSKKKRNPLTARRNNEEKPNSPRQGRRLDAFAVPKNENRCEINRFNRQDWGVPTMRGSMAYVLGASSIVRRKMTGSDLECSSKETKKKVKNEDSKQVAMACQHCESSWRNTSIQSLTKSVNKTMKQTSKKKKSKCSALWFSNA